MAVLGIEERNILLIQNLGEDCTDLSYLLLVRKAGVSKINYISHRSNEKQLMSVFTWLLLKTCGIADE